MKLNLADKEFDKVKVEEMLDMKEKVAAPLNLWANLGALDTAQSANISRHRLLETRVPRFATK